VYHARVRGGAYSCFERAAPVDRLELLEIDGSCGARKGLASELGCPADVMGESAKANVRLHMTVLTHTAEHGRNIPADVLG